MRKRGANLKLILGDKIRNLRKAANMTQQAFSQFLAQRKGIGIPPAGI